MNISSSSWLRLVLVLLVLAIIVGLGIANYRFTLEAPGGNDFLPRWVGARYWLIEGVNPYDAQVSLAAQNMIYGRAADPTKNEDVAHFVYPLPSMVFFAPFGLLPYPISRAVWMTLLEIGLPLLVLLGAQLAHWKPSGKLMVLLFLFSIGWYHGFRSVIVGQFAVIEALLMTGALFAIQRQQDNLAGVLLGLSISKPQMSALLIPFVLVWAIRSKRWELISWTLGTLIALIGVSLALINDWPLLWIRQLLEYSNYTTNPTPVTILANLVPIASVTLTYGLTALFVLYLLWEWVLAMDKGDRWFQWTAALTIVITNLIPLRTATTHYVVLIPTLCLIFSAWDERWGKKGRITIVFSLFVVFIGLWSLFLLTLEGNFESDIMYLPFPILLLFGLWWSRWWIVRASSLRV
ncbi:MAG TPA: DUF2029 domain-containing protein [Anaerolineae bacterium]|nr:DUF2029 domain-containing protein [Anaerolineae bacterium]